MREIRMNGRKHKQVDTYEVQVQRVREMRTPPVVYPTKMQIPFSPAEPSVLEESDPNVTKIIPLHDTTLHDEAMGVQDSLDQVPYSPQAITYSPPEPEKIALQPTWTQVEPAPVSSMQLPASEPAAPVSGTDVSPSIAQVSQMLINNPEIMQMAMQMLKTQQPIVTHEPAPTLPPPLPPASALPPRQNSDRHHPNRQWNAPSGDNYGNSSGGGAIRMHGESRNIDHQHLPYSRQNKHKPYGRKKGKALCRFYTTSQGCRSGDDCPFLHDRN
ncbi:hypothetical protein BX666DRAFT_1192284 [Dichotomocladium elegans]|nr:hypothetical protein BX666DRAFT_1192284 [Dichotomocladium elegans]